MGIKIKLDSGVELEVDTPAEAAELLASIEKPAAPPKPAVVPAVVRHEALPKPKPPAAPVEDTRHEHPDDAFLASVLSELSDQDLLYLEALYPRFAPSLTNPTGKGAAFAAFLLRRTPVPATFFRRYGMGVSAPSAVVRETVLRLRLGGSTVEAAPLGSDGRTTMKTVFHLTERGTVEQAKAAFEQVRTAPFGRIPRTGSSKSGTSSGKKEPVTTQAPSSTPRTMASAATSVKTKAAAEKKMLADPTASFSRSERELLAALYSQAARDRHPELEAERAVAARLFPREAVDYRVLRRDYPATAIQDAVEHLRLAGFKVEVANPDPNSPHGVGGDARLRVTKRGTLPDAKVAGGLIYERWS